MFTLQFSTTFTKKKGNKSVQHGLYHKYTPVTACKRIYLQRRVPAGPLPQCCRTVFATRAEGLGTRWGWRLRCGGATADAATPETKSGCLAVGFPQQQAAQPLNPNAASPLLLRRAAGAATRGDFAPFGELRLFLLSGNWMNDAFYDGSEIWYLMLGAFRSLLQIDFFSSVFCATEIPVVLNVYQMCKERKINDVHCF